MRNLAEFESEESPTGYGMLIVRASAIRRSGVTSGPNPFAIPPLRQQLLLDFMDRHPDEVLVQFAMKRFPNRGGIIRADHAECAG